MILKYKIKTKNEDLQELNNKALKWFEDGTSFATIIE